MQDNTWGQVVLFLIGFGLILYALFACLNAYPAKIFPTPLPSQVRLMRVYSTRTEVSRAPPVARPSAHHLELLLRVWSAALLEQTLLLRTRAEGLVQLSI